ncbi:MAG: FAD-dependent oxidoreductase [Thermoguttaceae bacterium]|nr:FAD-dependent oxidoreductase [Thermoguttaceae bacterium]
MKKLIALFLAFCASVPALCAETVDADVVIYGGASAAVSAAVQVRRMGKTAVIVMPDRHLGGLTVSGLGRTDSGDKRVIGGIAREFYHRVWLYYQDDEAWKWEPKPAEFSGMDNQTQTMWKFEPSAAEKVMDGFVAEYGIPVYRGERLDREKGVVKEGAAIKSIATLSGRVFTGRVFLDATYEGDLFAAAGVSYTVGRESNARYGETLNGIQTTNAVYHQFAGPVDPYVEPGNPDSGILPGVNPDAGGRDGDADGGVQAYCFRLCMTRVPENRVPFEKPADYDEADYELLFRDIQAGQIHYHDPGRVPNRKTDTNNNGSVSTDNIGANYEYPEASYERREEIIARHVRWQKGFYWTMANHPRVPEELRREFSEWGLAKDEFADSGNWPGQLYVREGRRMVSDFVETENHLRRRIPVPDPVGMGSYGMDSHNIQRYVAIDEDGRAVVRNEGDVQVPTGGAYPIGYRALLPKKEECSNLLVPVCVSCSHIAYGSIRMEPVFMILGQSAAAAAVLSIDAGVDPADLSYESLERRLRQDGQVLEKP